VGDENARSILLGQDAPRGRHIFLEGRERLLDDADVVAILDNYVVNALPAGTVYPGTVNQNNVPNAATFVLHGGRAAGQKQ
jgi:hypothetical protein